MNLKQMIDVKVNDFPLEMKEIGDDGSFEGYGSIFGNVDLGDDIVAKGSFVNSLKELKSTGRPLPILWQHNPREPIGYFSEVSEDAKGLRVKGHLLVDSVQRAKETFALLKASVVTGLSIGYRTIKSQMDEESGIRTLMELDLKEISFVTFPMNDEARTDTMKMKLAHGGLPTIREFEAVLRELGLSKQQATIAASKGFAAVLQRDSDGDNVAQLKSGLEKLLAKI